MVYRGEDTSYEDFKKFMKKPNPVCDDHKLGKYIDLKTAKIHVLRCKTKHCPQCRQIKKSWMYTEIIKNVYIFDLQRHFVITFPGKQIRSKVQWDQSYPYMNTRWHKLLKVIEYHFGAIDYIQLPRAQKDGYCHHHILLNKFIPWNFLNQKRAKYDLGFLSIQKNKDVAEYLCTDFWKDDEWLIPKNIRTYNTSRSIILNNVGKNVYTAISQPGITDEQITQYLQSHYNVTPDWDDFNQRMQLQKELKDYMEKWYLIYKYQKDNGKTYYEAKQIADELTGWCC